MKLFFCPFCSDVVKLTFDIRKCKCKKCYGYLVDNLKNKCETAYILKEAIPFALDNVHIAIATMRWKEDKRTSFIHGWTIDTTDDKNDCKIIIVKETKKSGI